jgi:AcrR family transcriptional regulator
MKRRKLESKTRQARKAETRALVLRVASNLFEAKGFEATTIRDVAAAAEVGTGTVFVHFAGKDELLYAVLFEELEHVVAKVLAAAPKPGLLDELRRIPAAFLRLYASRPALYRVLLRQSLIAEGEWTTRFRGQVQRVGVRTLEALNRGQADGLIASEVNLGTAATAYFAFYYFTLLQAANENFADVEGALDRIDALTRQQLGLEPKDATR